MRKWNTEAKCEQFTEAKPRLKQILFYLDSNSDELQTLPNLSHVKDKKFENKLSLASDKPQICLRISEFSSTINFWQNLWHLDSYFLNICQLPQKLWKFLSWGSFKKSKFSAESTDLMMLLFFLKMETANFWTSKRIFKIQNWSELNFKEILFYTCFCYELRFSIYRDSNMCLCSIAS